VDDAVLDYVAQRYRSSDGDRAALRNSWGRTRNNYRDRLEDPRLAAVYAAAFMADLKAEFPSRSWEQVFTGMPGDRSGSNWNSRQDMLAVFRAGRLVYGGAF